jgi:hypothetical protein
LSSPEPTSQPRITSDLGRTFPEHAIFSDGGPGYYFNNYVPLQIYFSAIVNESQKIITI